MILALPAALAGVVRIERMSPPPLDLEVSLAGTLPSISADGRFVVFWSYASNLVPGRTYDTSDVFVRDRQTGETELMSISASGVPANGYSDDPAISADGRFVAFSSSADNLVPGDTNGRKDVFVAERE